MSESLAARRRLRPNQWTMMPYLVRVRWCAIAAKRNLGSTRQKDPVVGIVRQPVAVGIECNAQHHSRAHRVQAAEGSTQGLGLSVPAGRPALGREEIVDCYFSTSPAERDIHPVRTTSSGRRMCDSAALQTLKAQLQTLYCLVK